MHVLAPLLAERYRAASPERPRPTEHLPHLTRARVRRGAVDVARPASAGARARRRVFAIGLSTPSRAPGQGQTEWEEHLIGAIRAKPIEETQKTALILARRGQGPVQAARPPSRGAMPNHRRRSHRASTREPLQAVARQQRLRAPRRRERPAAHAVDRSPVRSRVHLVRNRTAGCSCRRWRIAASLERMGVPLGERVNVGAFSEGQRRYLEFHQERVFLEAKVERR